MANDDNNNLPERPDAAESHDNAEARQPYACRRDCRRNKLHSFDWLSDIPGGKAGGDIVEVQFKNTRKGYFRNTTNLPLGPGDIVAVEATPGHDIGTVTLTGALAELRLAISRNTKKPELARTTP